MEVGGEHHHSLRPHKKWTARMKRQRWPGNGCGVGRERLQRALLSLFKLLALFVLYPHGQELKSASAAAPAALHRKAKTAPSLRFRSDGTFKILQVADLHLGDGAANECADIDKRFGKCSDLNSTWFVQRLISVEDPDLVVYSGDNIDWSSSNAIASMHRAFAPAIDAGKPWAAILGNHDQQTDLDRLGLMAYILGMPLSLAQLNPGCHVAENCNPVKGNFTVDGRTVSRDFRMCLSDSLSWVKNATVTSAAGNDVPMTTTTDSDIDNEWILFRCNIIDKCGGRQSAAVNGHLSNLPVVEGWGNYHLEVKGPRGSKAENDTALVLYLLDSGDSSRVPNRVGGYDWIRSGQQLWLKSQARKYLVSSAGECSHIPPALAYFHIPVPEYKDVANKRAFTGRWQEDVYAPEVNSGFFTTLVEAEHIKAAFAGHDHLNDFCGTLHGLQLCYGGAAGYHGYGRVGWDRRARVVFAKMSVPDGPDSLNAHHGGREKEVLNKCTENEGTVAAADSSRNSEYTASMGEGGAVGYYERQGGAQGRLSKPHVWQIWTWKRLDDGLSTKLMTEKDRELLWEFGKPIKDSSCSLWQALCLMNTSVAEFTKMAFALCVAVVLLVKCRKGGRRKVSRRLL